MTKKEIMDWLMEITPYIGDDDLIAIDEGGLCLVGVNNSGHPLSDDPEIYLEVGGIPEEEPDVPEKPLLGEKAREMWQAFSDNEKTGVRFGMFPAGPMKEAEEEGYDSHGLVICLMQVATEDGGMRS